MEQTISLVVNTTTSISQLSTQVPLPVLVLCPQLFISAEPGRHSDGSSNAVLFLPPKQDLGGVPSSHCQPHPILAIAGIHGITHQIAAYALSCSLSSSFSALNHHSCSFPVNFLWLQLFIIILFHHAGCIVIPPSLFLSFLLFPLPPFFPHYHSSILLQ